MDPSLTQKAIDYAIKNNWDEAIKINLQILKKNSQNIDALNRLSRAYYESGKLNEARKCSMKVIKIDKQNSIALKAVDKYKKIKSVKGKKESYIDPSVFIEELGKTKIVDLINIGPLDICSNLDCGDEVILTLYGHKVTVIDRNNKYIGKMPDDISAKLRKFIKGGNKYRVFIKSSNGKNIKVLIRETERGDIYKSTQSFPPNKSITIGENSSDSDY